MGVQAGGGGRDGVEAGVGGRVGGAGWWRLSCERCRLVEVVLW